ncbi:MAG: hypothetical protein M1837_004251 [Sclerophora amabilis]|nr:MAG: hypothetical protein M1837_004251 [Sclerophora amabilis]
MAVPFTVLTDDNVRTILYNLSRDDVQALQSSLAEALHTYSTGAQDKGACAGNQPHRTSITKDNATTLFMPGSTADTTGMKIVTLTTSNSGSRTSSISNNNNNSSSSASISNNSVSNSSINSSSTTLTEQSITPRGLLTLLSPTGQPLGLLAAEELTAFRTALAATMLLKRREHVHTIAVFGAGKQAYWHIRLSLLLRGAEIHRVNIINRTFARTEPMLREFYDPGPDDWRPPSVTKFSVLSKEYGEYERLLKENVRKADIIFCCTPSTEPLFPAEHLTATEGRKKGRYISAIGSYKPHMCELHPDIFRQAVQPPHHGHHFHKHASTSGVVIVDSLSACLKEAGEVIQAGLTPAQLVEIGELVMLKRQAMKGNPSGDPTAVEGVSQKAKEKGGLEEWLSKGNVIYKSVGMGLMDLVVGGELIKLAVERGVGTSVGGF